MALQARRCLPCGSESEPWLRTGWSQTGGRGSKRQRKSFFTGFDRRTAYNKDHNVFNSDYLSHTRQIELLKKENASLKKECSLLIKANFNCKASCKEHPLPI